MDFKKVYKLPLEKYEGVDKVFHANGHMAFDFLRRYKSGMKMCCTWQKNHRIR